MATYRRVDDLYIVRLTACTSGSAAGPTLGNEYGKPLFFLPSDIVDESVIFLAVCSLSSFVLSFGQIL